MLLYCRSSSLYYSCHNEKSADMTHLPYLKLFTCFYLYKHYPKINNDLEW